MRDKQDCFWKTLVVLICVAGLFWFLDQGGQLDWLRRPLEKVFNPIKRKVYLDYQVTGSQRDGEAVLKRENAALEVKLVELQKENERLQKLMGSPLPPDWQFVLAHVIGKEEGVLLLDVGRDQGVAQGQAVVSENHLLGQIVEVKPQASRMRLITAVGSRAPVMISGSVVMGEAVGRGGGLIMEKVLTQYDLAEGQLVVTSGDQEWPRNLVVGEVKEIDKQESALFQQAYLRSFWQAEGLDVVFVVRD